MLKKITVGDPVLFYRILPPVTIASQSALVLAMYIGFSRFSPLLALLIIIRKPHHNIAHHNKKTSS